MVEHTLRLVLRIGCYHRIFHCHDYATRTSGSAHQSKLELKLFFWRSVVANSPLGGAYRELKKEKKTRCDCKEIR